MTDRDRDAAIAKLADIIADLAVFASEQLANQDCCEDGEHFRLSAVEASSIAREFTQPEPDS
jgi:hypothetical protein